MAHHLSVRDALQLFRVASLPPDFYYIPNFISEEEEASILQKIPAQRWISLSHRRLQAHPSTLTKNNTLLTAPLPPYLVNPVVERFKAIDIFANTPHKEPNHVLINEYRRGQGIMPHEDGGAYAPVVATVSLGAPICLEISRKPASREDENGATLQEPADTPPSLPLSTPSYNIPTRILQEPRSLLITTGSAYTELLHGIAPLEVDEDLGSATVANWDLLAEPYVFEESGRRNERDTRISLTYRDVLKVSSAASKVFGGLGKR
ncbi:hypothetical protein BU26DRAFT_426018 [Trematosphaeria pertusa]|uniref:Fe2OG dioxygenase domain-containing protein n=1 Tax=Trematosphaeria pertusa TaxID=390896 RepID=A0A6A6IFC8_9PLEO|nr:uncharacterized protein BU26DRAFT_426018 [Trematosphaeria pertusa]KAF2249141.1 hypothetical protein BU26DRAFT_426018 [Trematosphaeria pertusa]